MQTAATLPVLSSGGRLRARRFAAPVAPRRGASILRGAAGPWATAFRALCTCGLLVVVLGATRAEASSRSADDPIVVVSETAGVFAVEARFQVPQSPSAVLAVLTDYEGIPRVMPHVTRSLVKGPSPEGVFVEQTAVSRVLFFSKTVHLLLDVRETGSSLTFRDVGARSFHVYEGAWQVAPIKDATLVTYQLRARPAFEVPDFLVKRLFKRDAIELIARLRKAIAS